MRIEEKYEIDKAHECREVFKTIDPKHPGVAKVLAQGEVNLPDLSGSSVNTITLFDFPVSMRDPNKPGRSLKNGVGEQSLRFN